MNSKVDIMKPGSRKIAIASGLMAVFLFGASFVAIKIALQQVEPMTLIPVRFALGLVLLWPFMAIQGQVYRPSRAELLRTAVLGGLAILLNQWLQAGAMQSAGATTASWLSALAPAFMAILAWIFLRESIVSWQWLGIALALVGALLVSDADPASTFDRGSWIAPSLLILSAIAWAVFSVFGKAEASRTSPLRASVMSMSWALVFGVILNLYIGSGWGVLDWGWQSWGALLFLGVACTGIAYALYFYALAGAQSALVAALQYLEPLITILLAYFLLQEVLPPVGFIGGILILVGIVLVERAGVTNFEV